MQTPAHIHVHSIEQKHVTCYKQQVFANRVSCKPQHAAMRLSVDRIAVLSCHQCQCQLSNVIIQLIVVDDLLILKPQAKVHLREILGWLRSQGGGGGGVDQRLQAKVHVCACMWSSTDAKCAAQHKLPVGTLHIVQQMLMSGMSRCQQCSDDQSCCGMLCWHVHFGSDEFILRQQTYL